jgi:hypothetical protein
MNAAGVALVAELLRQAIAVSQLVAQANAEGRELAKEELDSVVARADQSEIDRDAAIERAKAEGR